MTAPQKTIRTGQHAPSGVLQHLRVLQHLHERLIQNQRCLWYANHHGDTLDLRRAAREALRASLASYIGHARHASAWNLLQRVFDRHRWLYTLFFLHDGLRLQPRWQPPY